MWDMIDLSAMPPGHPGVQSGDVSLHHAFQERFWEHTPTSTTDFWDEYSRVRKIPAVHKSFFQHLYLLFCLISEVLSSPTLQLNHTLQPKYQAGETVTTATSWTTVFCRYMSSYLALAKASQRAFTLYAQCLALTSCLRKPSLHLRMLKTHSAMQAVLRLQWSEPPMSSLSPLLSCWSFAKSQATTVAWSRAAQC